MKKWHQLLEKPTVPSIPPKNKEVPQSEEDIASSGEEGEFVQKKEQVIQMIQATPPTISDQVGGNNFYTQKMNPYQQQDNYASTAQKINTDLVNA